MMEFKATSKAEGDHLTLLLEGTIDEDTVFPVVDTTKFTKLTLDLQGVKTINSVGIREWLEWIRPVAEKVHLTLSRCPKALVFQFNMVEGFLPAKAVVSSFYVPYFCEKCDREDAFLFNMGKEVTVAGGVVKFAFDTKAGAACKEATCEMEMDVTEGKYFQFLKKA